MKKRTSIILVIVAVVVVIAVISDSPSDSPANDNADNKSANQNMNAFVGGPCEYDTFEGTCTIESVEPYEDSETGYTVEYSLAFPFDEIPEDLPSSFDYEPDALYSVNIFPADASEDAESCIEFNDIEEGNDVDCELKIITDGTCAPEIVQLTDIDDSCRQVPT